MLPKSISSKSLINAFCFWLFLGLVLFVLPVYLPVYAQTGGNQPIGISGITPQSILQNIEATVPNLMRMVTAFAYVIGFYMVISGIMKLKHVGEMRTQMSHEHHLSGPLLLIVIGSLLIYLPSSVQVGMSTFWSSPNPYGYLEQEDQWAQFFKVCFMVIQFIGVIAFIRGLVLLSKAGGGHQQGSFGKGVTHVIGGIFCINLYQFIQVVLATIGITS